MVIVAHRRWSRAAVPSALFLAPPRYRAALGIILGGASATSSTACASAALWSTTSPSDRWPTFNLADAAIAVGAVCSSC